MKNLSRTVVEVDTTTWADVKHFATVERLTLNLAVERLLERALKEVGYQKR